MSELPAAVQVAQKNFFSGRSEKRPPAHQPVSASTGGIACNGEATGTAGEKTTSSEGQETTAKARSKDQETEEKGRETGSKAEQTTKKTEAQEIVQKKKAEEVLAVGISGKRVEIVQDPSK